MSPSTVASPPGTVPDFDGARLNGSHVCLWPYARGLYPRDMLYRLWRLIEDMQAAPKLFFGSQDPVEMVGDLTALVKFFDTTDRLLLFVCDRASLELAGALWFDDIVPHHRAFGSIVMRPKYWGDPTQEAVRLFLDYGFSAMDFRQVWAATPWKTAKRMCARAGFESIATLPDFALIRGVPTSVDLVRITRENFYG